MSPVLRSWVCHPWSFRGFLRYHVSISILHTLGYLAPFFRKRDWRCEPSVVLVAGGDQARPTLTLYCTTWPHTPPDLDVAQLDHLLHLNLMLQALQQVEVYSSSTNSCRFSLPSLPGRVCQKKFLRSLCHPCQVGCFKRKSISDQVVLLALLARPLLRPLPRLCWRPSSPLWRILLLWVDVEYFKIKSWPQLWSANECLTLQPDLTWAAHSNMTQDRAHQTSAVRR